MYAPFDFRFVINLPAQILEHHGLSCYCQADFRQRERCVAASNFQEEIMDENNAVRVVEDLIETCKDGQKGYQEAASKVKRNDLKTFFNEQSLERGRFAGELDAELKRLGEKDKKVTGSVAGTLHRAWIDTKVGLGGGDKTVLEWLEHGEDTAKDAYNKALSGNLPGNVLEIVRRQAASVQKAHDKVKTLRDTAEAAA
jgi:uncharacterized protein (TIGR02284 family)